MAVEQPPPPFAGHVLAPQLQLHPKPAGVTPDASTEPMGTSKNSKDSATTTGIARLITFIPEHLLMVKHCRSFFSQDTVGIESWYQLHGVWHHLLIRYFLAARIRLLLAVPGRLQLDRNTTAGEREWSFGILLSISTEVPSSNSWSVALSCSVCRSHRNLFLGGIQEW